MSVILQLFNTLQVVVFFFLARMDATTWANDEISSTFPSDNLPLTDDTIYEAVDLWSRGGSSRESAQILYGADIGKWNTSLVTSMAKLFQNQPDFQEDIRGWDVSRVTTLREAFQGASSFNYDLSEWNVAQVTDFGRMFVGASSLEASICWRSISWAAFVKNMFCGTAGASFDPCCVDETLAMTSCCGNQACNAICNPHDLHHVVTPSAVDVDQTVALEQSMQSAAGDQNAEQEQPSAPKEEGQQVGSAESTNDITTNNNDTSENDGENNSPASTSAPISSGSSNTEKGDVVEPTTVAVVNVPPSSNTDSLTTDQETDSTNPGSSAEKSPSKRRLILGFVLAAFLVSFLGFIAAMVVCRRLQRTDMILDPDSTTMTGKQVPTAEEEEEENEDVASNAERRHDPYHDTMADTEAPTLADDDVTLGTLPTLGSLPVVPQYFFFSGDTNKNIVATTEQTNKDILATTESVAEETFNPLLQFLSLGSGSVAETSYTTPQKGGEDTAKDEEAGLAAMVQSISLGGGNVDQGDDETVTVNFSVQANAEKSLE